MNNPERSAITDYLHGRDVTRIDSNHPLIIEIMYTIPSEHSRHAINHTIATALAPEWDYPREHEIIERMLSYGISETLIADAIAANSREAFPGARRIHAVSLIASGQDIVQAIVDEISSLIPEIIWEEDIEKSHIRR